MDKLERRYWPIEEIRIVSDDDGTRKIEWYASVFDSLSEELYGFWEKVSRRAFSRTLQNGSDVRALFNHDPNFVLGRNKSGTLKLHVDHTGLRSTVTPPDTQWANDLMVSIERGDVNAGSFGFQVVQDNWTQDAEGRLIRELKEVKLFDVSVVTYPAYPATEGVALRSAVNAAGLDIEGLIHPLLRLRSGQPLAAEEKARYQAELTRLHSALNDPPQDDEPASITTTEAGADDDGHSWRLAARRRQLVLIELGGGTANYAQRN